jgi:hypothetical protein
VNWAWTGVFAASMVPSGLYAMYLASRVESGFLAWVIVLGWLAFLVYMTTLFVGMTVNGG